MFLKLFIVMLASCSVQSSVIVAVFQDDNDGGAVSQRSCSNDACNLYCLRHLFLGGYCFGNTCKCYGGLREDDTDTDNSENDSSEKKIHESESSEIKASVSCNNQGCDRLCRRLGFPDGECLGDTCKCDLNDETLTTDVPGACNTDVCSYMCHSMNYIDGMCRAGNCQCY